MTKRVCAQTPVKSPRYVEVPRCSNVPKTDCKEVTRQATEIKCEPIEEQKCAQVPKQVTGCATIPFKVISRDNRATSLNPYHVMVTYSLTMQATVEVPLEICEDIPMENCVDVPKQVAKKVCKEYKH